MGREGGGKYSGAGGQAASGRQGQNVPDVPLCQILALYLGKHGAASDCSGGSAPPPNWHSRSPQRMLTHQPACPEQVRIVLTD